MHPSSGITKEYSVTLDRKPRQADLEAIAGGCDMSGTFVQPVAVLRDDTDATKPNRVRIVVAEGRNREVRGHGARGLWAASRHACTRRRSAASFLSRAARSQRAWLPPRRCATWWSTRGWR